MNPLAAIHHVQDGELQYDAIAFVCPGCTLLHEGASGLHLLPVNSAVKTPTWDWNGDLVNVTLSPSILTHYRDSVCHSFLRDAVFEYLPDCTHLYAGQHVPMVPLEDWML